MNEIINVSGIRCYEENGMAYLSLEDVARGLGFTRVAASGNEVVRWETVRKYLSELGVPTSWHDGSQLVGNDGLPAFIPENIFYRLCMKARNETAELFQRKIADEVIPAIRRTGGYMPDMPRLIAQTVREAVRETVKQLSPALPPPRKKDVTEPRRFRTQKMTCRITDEQLEMCAQLAWHLHTSKADVMTRGLELLYQRVTEP